MWHHQKHQGRGLQGSVPLWKELMGWWRPTESILIWARSWSQSGNAWQKKLLLVVLPFFIPILAAVNSMQPIWPLLHSASTELATQTLFSRKWNQNEQSSGHLGDRCKGWPLSIPSECSQTWCGFPGAICQKHWRHKNWSQQTSNNIKDEHKTGCNEKPEVNSGKWYNWLQKVALLNIFCDQNVETSVFYWVVISSGIVSQ